MLSVTERFFLLLATSGYIWHLILLVAVLINIELLKSDNIDAVKEIKNLHFLNFWCDLYNILIGLGVFCFGWFYDGVDNGFFIFSGLACTIINIAPTIFLVIFNADRTETSRFTFRAMMFILQTVCFAIIVVCLRDFTGEQLKNFWKTYGLLPIMPGYVFSVLMFILTLVRNKTLVRSRKSQEEQLQEMKPSLQESLMN